MKAIEKYLSILFFWVGCFQVSFAEYFTIESFHSDITLNRDGSFDVVETISVNFSEKRRGIFRDIPYSYYTTDVEGEQAIGHIPGEYYQIYLDKIQVKGHPFEVIDLNGQAKRIRIGKEDVFLIGKVTYEISYRVWGAINQFKQHNEFYWNINGNKWDVPCDVVSADIYLPGGKLKLKDGEFKAFTGTYRSILQEYKITSEPGLVQIISSVPFKEREGLTILLKLPKQIFQFSAIPLNLVAKNNYFTNIRSTMQLQNNGRISVQEEIDLGILERMQDVLRTFPVTQSYAPTSDDSSFSNVRGIIQAKNPPSATASGRKYRKIEEVNFNNSALDLGLGMSYENDGKAKFGYDILYCGHYLPDGGQVYYIPWLGNQDAQPIYAASADITLPPGATLGPRGVVSNNPNVSIRTEGNRIHLELTSPLMPSSKVFVAVYTQGGNFQPEKKLARYRGSGTFWESIHSDILVASDGKVHVKQTFKAPPKAAPDQLSFSIANQHRFNPYADFDTDEWQHPSPTLFGGSGTYLFGGMESNQDLTDYDLFDEHHIQIGLYSQDPDSAAEIVFSYWIYGKLIQENGLTALKLNLFDHITCPAERVTFTLQAEGNAAIKPEHLALFYTADYNDTVVRSPQVELVVKNGVLHGTLPNSLFEEDKGVHFTLKFPDDVSRSSFFLDLRAFWLNQSTLCLCILLSLALGLVWYFFGKDKPLVTVVQFYPPKSTTSAEAGALYDGDLNDRDILSLIYSWAALGIIQIETHGEDENDESKTDFTLHKLKELPKTAKNYEKTLFNGLFEKRESIKVSKLAQTFYYTMYKVRTEINAEFEKKSYFVPGTRGSGFLLRLFGALLLILTGIIFLGSIIELFDPIQETADYTLGFGILGLTSFLIGKIIPKRTSLGHREYEELMGFREFLQTAEADKLRLLVDQDPGYFGLSLSYAIGLGLATQWVEKFKPLLAEPPSFVKTSNKDYRYDTFDRLLTRNLNAMVKHFNSAPPASYSSSGSYSSYSSSSRSSYSSSSSSFGSSGGSGFSGGGGYSGGGYGGGGGGSW